MTQAYTDEPLDLGDLMLAMSSPPLHTGDMAPLFEARTLDGKDIRPLSLSDQLFYEETSSVAKP